ncbi:MAG: Fic family protein [bacterium]|nr:Fic family protein [bacterium]
MFKPIYKLTNKIVAILTAIAESKASIERAKILPQSEIKLRRQALIRMTHSSTEIEGNVMNLKQVEALAAHKKIDAPSRDIYEAENYFKALKYIGQFVQKKQPIREKTLLKIHKLVTDKTLPKEQSGYYRRGPIFIVRRRMGLPDETVYAGPDAKDVPRLCFDLIKWLGESEEQNINPVIAAGILHQEIAAIHPFNDGNGRTARAMATLVLYQRGYDFRRLFALEDYYNRDRSKYYAAINVGKNYQERKTDITSWLEYFVKGFGEEIDRVKAQVISLSFKKVAENLKSKIYLDQDQLKLLDFLDQVGRITIRDAVDILSCPKRTAQLKLRQLKNMGVISQIGKGPSSAYILK